MTPSTPAFVEHAASVRALARLPPRGLARSSKSALLVPGLGVAAVVGLGLFAPSLPVLVFCALLAVAGPYALAVTLIARGEPREPDPDEIAWFELRETFRAIVQANREVHDAATAALARAPLASLLERCDAVVAQCGRMARAANPLQRYLEQHDPAWIRDDLGRLRERTERTQDEQAVRALSRAAEARTRQLATYDDMLRLRDRLLARLELVCAALASFAALLVKLRAVDDEQLAFAGDQLSEQLDGVGEELAAVESTLHGELET